MFIHRGLRVIANTHAWRRHVTAVCADASHVCEKRSECNSNLLEQREPCRSLWETVRGRRQELKSSALFPAWNRGPVKCHGSYGLYRSKTRNNDLRRGCRVLLERRHKQSRYVNKHCAVLITPAHSTSLWQSQSVFGATGDDNYACVLKRLRIRLQVPCTGKTNLEISAISPLLTRFALVVGLCH